MMNFARRTAQLLHQDHQDTIAIIESLDQLIAQTRRGKPDITDRQVRNTLERAASAIAGEVSQHFAFEETELFSRLSDLGDTGIVMHLTEEHQVILPLGQQVAAAASAALQDGFSDAEWVSFRSLAGELIERMFAHIQKEEMALLPMLEDLLDAETDMALATAYSQIQ